MVAESLPRAMALDKLEALTDTVLTNNAEGKTLETRHDGSPVPPPEKPPNIIKLVGLTERQNELRREAGLPPLEEPLTPAQQYARMRAEIERRREDGD